MFWTILTSIIVAALILKILDKHPDALFGVAILAIGVFVVALVFVVVLSAWDIIIFASSIAAAVYYYDKSSKSGKIQKLFSSLNNWYFWLVLSAAALFLAYVVFSVFDVLFASAIITIFCVFGAGIFIWWYASSK